MIINVISIIRKPLGAIRGMGGGLGCRNIVETTMVDGDNGHWLVLVFMETPWSFVENSG